MAEQLPDRPVVQISLRAAWTLFTQPWILVPSIPAVVLIAAYFMTLTPPDGKAQDIPVLLGISVLCGFGFGVMTGLPSFFIYRALVPTPGWVAQDDEPICASFAANHPFDGDSRGGKLHLTTRHVAFVPHRFNLKMKSIAIPYGEVMNVVWGRMTTPAGLRVASSVVITTPTGEEQFLLRPAEQVADLIERLAACREADRAGVAAQAKADLELG